MSDEKVSRPGRGRTLLTVVAVLVAGGVGGTLIHLGGQAAAEETQSALAPVPVEPEVPALAAAYNPDAPGTLHLVSSVGQIVGSVAWPASEDCGDTMVLPLLTAVDGTVGGSVEVCSGT